MSGAEGTQTSPIHAFPLTQKLASFVVETAFGDIPATALEHGRQLILDTLGVSLLASRHLIGELIRSHASMLGGHRRTASVLGPGNLRVDTVWAAQANGTLANALDYDSGGHLPTHILPAILAIAEERRLSGADVLGAFVLAYEASARLTKVIDAKRAQQQGPTYRGWWHVGLIAPVAACLAACRLLGANVSETRCAMGVATASSAGFRRNMGTMTKALHSGNGARGGIEAAMLAMQGFTGDPEMIEGELGFASAIAFEDERDPAPVMEKLGAPYVLEKPPGVKRYPAVTPSHGVISAAIELARTKRFDPGEIISVEADYRTFSLTRQTAENEEEAGFCAPFLIASALVHGEFGPSQIAGGAIDDQRVQALSRKVKQIPKTEGEGNIVIVRLANADTISARARGSRAFEQDFIEAKFRACALHAGMQETTVAEMVDIVGALDHKEDLARLMRLARGA